MDLVIFVLVATAINTDGVGGAPATQTIRYYATAAECQTDLLRVEKTRDGSYVRLDCRPLKVKE